MRAPIYEASSEYCPHIREEAAIEVKFVHVPILGTAAPQYKKCAFECSVSDCDLNGVVQEGSECHHSLNHRGRFADRRSSLPLFHHSVQQFLWIPHARGGLYADAVCHEG